MKREEKLKELNDAIASHAARRAIRRDAAIEAIREGYWLTAMSSLADCIKLDGAIEELAFQLEVLECEG